MSRILKWTVPINDQEHPIGQGPVVHVDVDPGLEDFNSVYVWTQEPDEENPAKRLQYALVVGTGQPFDGWRWEHEGSVIAPPFVWHVLTRRESAESEGESAEL